MSTEQNQPSLPALDVGGGSAGPTKIPIYGHSIPPVVLAADYIKLREKWDSVEDHMAETYAQRDELITELSMMKLSRDQWRDCATKMATALRDFELTGRGETPGSEIFPAATITGSNEQKDSEMPAEGKGERQSAGTASGRSAQAPAFSDQKQGTPVGLFQNEKIGHAGTPANKYFYDLTTNAG